MGACFDCVVTIDGRIGQRACMTIVADGMQITGAAACQTYWPRWQPIRPPTPQSNAAATCWWSAPGPAGLSAAIAAAAAGAQVVVLDERSAPGGQYLKPLAPGHANAAPDAQFRRGDALCAAAARAAGVRIETGATAWGAFASPTRSRPWLAASAITYRPRRLILAPGAHERPVPLPGWTLPGVMTTGALQTLVRTQRVLPGRQGRRRRQRPAEHPARLRTARRRHQGRGGGGGGAWSRPGSRIRHDADVDRAAPDLAREGLHYLARLRRAGIPMLWNSRALALEGTDRVAAIRLATPAGEQRILIDLVALNMGFQPEVGLARALDVPHRFVDTGIGHLATETDAAGRTAVAGVFAVGDGASRSAARGWRSPAAAWRASPRPPSWAFPPPIPRPICPTCAARWRSRMHCGACSARLPSTPARSPTTPSSAGARK